jgi:hypothetical protein
MRTLRRHRVKIAIAAFAAALVAFIAIFVESYNSGNDSAAPTLGPTGALPTTTAVSSPSATKSTSASSKPKRTLTGFPSGGVTNFTFPNGQSFTGGNTDFFKFQNQHLVQLRVFSAGNVQLIRVGWLAPESYDAPYGDLKSLASPWSLTLHSSGDKYHAALFVGTDNTGNPVTCQIYVDGKLKDSQTARFPGAHQVCVG